MKFCILGSGLMGRAIALDLLSHGNVEKVLICDVLEENLNLAKKLINDSRLIIEKIDVSNDDDVLNIFKKVNLAIGAVSYSFNERFTKLAIKSKIHFCDLGGNNEVVNNQLKLNEEAKNAKVSIIPDCGLAPGLVSVLTKWGLEKFSWTDTVKIRVGGLPVNPENIIKYERLFSIDGLINEYVESVKVLRDGKILEIEPLSEIEEITFQGMNQRFEAFTTSGGVSTLIETYKNKLKNLDYKTIRYPGHCNIMRSFYELGFFNGENRKFIKKMFEESIPICKNDITLVKIIFEGKNNYKEIEIIDKSKDGLTSMMRMTAFPVAIISYMQANGEIKSSGVLPQEIFVDSDSFIKELSKREILIRSS